MMHTRMCSQGLFPYEALVASQRYVDNPTINCEMGALSRREEVVVYKGDTDIGHKALDMKTDRVPDFQAVLEGPETLAPRLSDQGIPCTCQPGAETQEEVLYRDLEEVADPSSVQGDKTLIEVPPRLDGPVERSAE